jgi:hypothetical protein
MAAKLASLLRRIAGRLDPPPPAILDCDIPGWEYTISTPTNTTAHGTVKWTIG